MALSISGDHFVNALGARVTLRGLSTQGMCMIYGDKLNPGTYVPMTVNQYIDRAIQTDTTGQVWRSNCLRLIFERFPCANPQRLYTVENVPWCIPETIQFSGWQAAHAYAEGNIVSSGSGRYICKRKAWRGDRGFGWNPTPYQVGEITVQLDLKVYRCTQSNGTGNPNGDWGAGPSGTGTNILEDQGNLTYRWDYIGEFGAASGSVTPSSLTPVSDNAQDWLVDNLVTWQYLSANYDSPTAEANFAAWKLAVFDPPIARCIANGLYAIICEFDFGPAHHPLRYARMLDWWARIAADPLYKNHPQVIFELWNESEDLGTAFPGGPGTWSLQKQAITDVIDVIRNVGANNLIIVPTPGYSGQVGEACLNPISRSGLAYALHCYRIQWENYPEARSAMYDGFGTGLPIVMTEWGDDASSDPDQNWTVTTTVPPALRALIGATGTHPIAGWTAWALTRYWSPGLFNNDALTTPTGFGIATRRWLLDEA